MASRTSKVGHGLAKVLGIKLDENRAVGPVNVTRGESVYSVSSADSYVEDEPTSLEWVQSVIPSFSQLLQYLINLFPFVHWIDRYNLQWLYGDLVAGITVGAVVVPQSMAYAKLAEVPVQFGLYSSFMGVLIYWFFATSKDITIGPVAVLSTVTGDVVNEVLKADKHAVAHVVASALAVISGAIVCFIGLIRCGWITDVISLTAISAFMTGSAINIASGQFPSLMGIPTGLKAGQVNNRGPTYLVIINSLKYLGKTNLNAAIGLTALTMLYGIRFIFNQLAKRQPQRRKLWFFCNTLRTAFVILLYTMISWLVNRHIKHHNSANAHFSILGTVPRGFQDAAVPKLNARIIGLFANKLPATVIVMLIEHISISKSFGRVNNYTIDPSQELVAIGVTNLLGPFLGAYPATGSFSRTAIKSKAGVRTPFAGVITALVVLLAIYALPAVFFYIPNAALSAVIIHAVLDLVTPPDTVYRFWRISPIEVIIFFAGVLVTVFTTIEYGVYVTISVSMAVFLFRAFKAQGRFLGRVKVHSVLGDHVIGNDEQKDESGLGNTDNDPDTSARNLFLPIDHGDGSNPSVQTEHPYPGVFIYRFSEGFNYPNANHYTDYLVKQIFQETRRTNPHAYPRLGDRPWNNPGPRRGKPLVVDSHKPTLKAVILDFSSVNNVDITSVQNLIDVRNQLDLYTAPERVQWHFACINNRWTKRALASAGFGFPAVENEDEGFRRWKPIFSVAEIGGAAADAERAARVQHAKDLESGRRASAAVGTTTTDREVDSIDSSEGSSHDVQNVLDKSHAYRTKTEEVKVALVHSLNRPFFHIDLTSALQSVVQNIELHGGQSDGAGETTVEIEQDDGKKL